MDNVRGHKVAGLIVPRRVAGKCPKNGWNGRRKQHDGQGRRRSCLETHNDDRGEQHEQRGGKAQTRYQAHPRAKREIPKPVWLAQNLGESYARDQAGLG